MPELQIPFPSNHASLFRGKARHRPTVTIDSPSAPARTPLATATACRFLHRHSQAQLHVKYQLCFESVPLSALRAKTGLDREAFILEASATDEFQTSG